ALGPDCVCAGGGRVGARELRSRGRRRRGRRGGGGGGGGGRRGLPRRDGRVLVDEDDPRVEADRLDLRGRCPARGRVDQRQRRDRRAVLLQQTDRPLRKLHIRLGREGRRGVAHLDDDGQRRSRVGGHL